VVYVVDWGRDVKAFGHLDSVSDAGGAAARVSRKVSTAPWFSRKFYKQVFECEPRIGVRADYIIPSFFHLSLPFHERGHIDVLGEGGQFVPHIDVAHVARAYFKERDIPKPE